MISEIEIICYTIDNNLINNNNIIMIKEIAFYFVNKKATNKNETNRKIFETNFTYN